MIIIGQCKGCQEFFPPEFMVDEKKCLYCEGGSNTVYVTNENNERSAYSKKQCTKDYKLFLKELKKMPGVANALAQKRVDFIPKGE